MPTDQSCQVLTAGFSFHRKPYAMVQPEGVKNYLLRLQTDGRCRSRIRRGHVPGGCGRSASF